MRVKLTLADGSEYSVTAEAAARIARVQGLDQVLAGLVPKPGIRREDCPYCGWRDEEFKATGYVGCPMCYSALKSLERPKSAQ